MLRQIILLVIITLLHLQTAAAEPTLLFDQGHGQAFTVERDGPLQLGNFAERFRVAGWNVAVASSPFTIDRLADVDALVISGPFQSLDSSESEALAAFLLRGGRLALMLHVPQPLVPFLARLGVITANGVIREAEPELVLDGEPTNFRVVDLESHPLTAGLSSFALYGGWPLLAEGEGCRTVASSSSRAWVDLNRDRIFSTGDARQQLSLLVVGRYGKGKFAVFADDAIFQNSFLKGDNIKLADNLARWLKPEN